MFTSWCPTRARLSFAAPKRLRRWSRRSRSRRRSVGSTICSSSRIAFIRLSLPFKGMPPGWSRILVHLDAKDEDIHSRFRCHGSPQKSQEIFRLCRGNSRLMFAAAFSFVGPCCKPFRLRAPGVQSVGKEDSGKTVLGIIAGATYGGVPDSSLGFGSAWNGTPNGLEEYGPAHNDTLMVLDETSLMPTDQKGRPLAFGEALMRLMQGQGKKRHGLPVDRWSDPTFSTSNRSVYALLDPVRRKSYGAYTDRLMDIPTPNHAESHFEELHGHENAAAFGKYLFDIATTNYGYPIRVFLARFTSALARDREGLVATVAGNVATYEAAASKITSSQRSVLRVRGHFATVYAVGCLAIQLQILPFTEDELLAAVLSCHRDHVAFVDNEVVGGPPWSVGAAAVQEVVDPGSVRTPIAGAVVPAATPFDRLRRYIIRHRERRLHRRSRARPQPPALPSHETTRAEIKARPCPRLCRWRRVLDPWRCLRRGRRRLFRRADTQEAAPTLRAH